MVFVSVAEKQRKKHFTAKGVETLGLITSAVLALKRLFSIAIIMESAKKIVAIVKTRVSYVHDDNHKDSIGNSNDDDDNVKDKIIN